MKDRLFCFIIPRTPVQYETPLRAALWKISRQSIISQKYDNWIAIVIGAPEEHGDPRFFHLEGDLVPKAEKIDLALGLLREKNLQPDYLVRFDDDDLFSDSILQMHRNATFDCLVDEYHSFIEVATRRIGQQKRNWFANTVIHKFEHAVIGSDPKKTASSLLAQDHSLAWHKYYADKEVMYTSKFNPIYLRILSPFSITSKAADTGLDRGTDYLNYLLRFGSWSVDRNEIRGFSQCIRMLEENIPDPDEFDLIRVKFPFWKLLKNKVIEFKTK